MTITELLTLIGELVLTEIEDVNRVLYPKGEAPAMLTILFENGKKFIVNIAEEKN